MALWRERWYIQKRRAKAFFSGLAYGLCRVFPINPNKVVMWTFEGNGGFGCSPRYIAQELLRRNGAGETRYQIYWLVCDMEKEFPPEIQKVRSTLWSRAYHLSTARFWVANTRTFYGAKKRKGTAYFQTWHGTVSLKPIGKYRGDQLPQMACLASEADSRLMDYALSGSRWCTETWRDGLIYQGEILETGTPRCDVLFTGAEEKRRQLREEYHLPMDSRILLYAPTFRGGSQNTARGVSAEAVSIQFSQVIRALEERFGGTWYVFLRLHPQLAAQMGRMPVGDGDIRLIDVSQRPDMNEIIAASDGMITDYSSAAFESMLIRQPVFLYIDDLREYIADRGKLMFTWEEIPFSVAFDPEGLVRNILAFDQEKYEGDVERFIKKTGIIEDGHASQRVADLLEENGIKWIRQKGN